MMPHSEQLLELFKDLVTDLAGARLTAEVAGAQAHATHFGRVKDLAHCCLDRIGLLRLAKGVAQEHSSREDGTNRVGNSLAGNVRSLETSEDEEKQYLF